MRAYSSFPLDDDLVDRVMCFMCDFESLRSFALSCKSVCAVWNQHPRSIAIAIAKNIIGPTWPFALRTARLMLLCDPDKGWVGPIPARPGIAGGLSNVDKPVDNNLEAMTDEEEDDDHDTSDEEDEEEFSWLKVPDSIKSAAVAAVLLLPDEQEDYSGQITFREGKHLETMGYVAHTLEYQFSQR